MRKLFTIDRSILVLLIFTVLIFVILSLALPGKFFTAANLQSMMVQLPEFGILAIAIMLTMISGGIDLSIVGTANLSAIIAATAVIAVVGAENVAGPQLALATVIALVVALLIGSLCGLLNGYLVARLGIPPILATLGTMSLFTGFSYVVTGGPAITLTIFDFIGNGQLAGLPIPMLIFVVLVLVFGLLLNRTTLGFHIYMVGANEKAARFSGIPNERVLMRTYWLSGLLAAIAGLVFLARSNTAKADYGDSFVLLTVLISILGGVSYTGGFGKISGLLLAVLSLQFLSTGLNMLMLQLSGSGSAIFFRQLAWGVLLLSVMVLNQLRAERQAKQVIR